MPMGVTNNQIWTGNEELSEEIQAYVSRRTLSGEVNFSESIEVPVETKFHVLSEIGMEI